MYPFHPYEFGCSKPKPEHDPKHQLDGFETQKEARQRRKKDIKVLRGGDNSAKNLARRLAKCRKGKRCCRSSCRVCNRRFRRWFVGAAGSAIEASRFSGKPLLAVSLVSDRLQFPPGQLEQCWFTAANDTLRRQLDRSGLGNIFAIGGIDISFNHDHEERYPAHWRIHHFQVVGGCTADQLRAALERYYPVTPDVPKPLHIQRVDDPIRALSYAYKAHFMRRENYRGRNGRYQTREYPLKNPQLRELLLCLDRHNPTNRLFLWNVGRNRCELVIERPPRPRKTTVGRRRSGPKTRNRRRPRRNR